MPSLLKSATATDSLKPGSTICTLKAISAGRLFWTGATACAIRRMSSSNIANLHSRPLLLPASARWRHETRQAELRVWAPSPSSTSDATISPDGRPHLKAMAGAAANNPHIRRARVPVDDEMVVRRGFVLTHFRGDEGRVSQCGKPERHECAGASDPLGAHRPLAARRIDRRPRRIVCDLESG